VYPANFVDGFGLLTDDLWENEIIVESILIPAIRRLGLSGIGQRGDI
jgi:hypothetical protein